MATYAAIYRPCRQQRYFASRVLTIRTARRTGFDVEADAAANYQISTFAPLTYGVPAISPSDTTLTLKIASTTGVNVTNIEIRLNGSKIYGTGADPDFPALHTWGPAFPGSNAELDVNGDYVFSIVKPNSWIPGETYSLVVYTELDA